MNPDEAAALALVSERLGRRFPDRSAEEIQQAMDTSYHEFDGRPVRSFIPILVEREVVDLFSRRQSSELSGAH